MYESERPCGCDLAMGDDNELFKFPRTKHLFDAGGQGVSRDDLLMDAGEEALFYTRRGAQMPTRVTIEEKVDGANIGISIGSDMRISVQNRSHYVNSKTHKQFGSLDKWLDDHSAALFQVLEPGRHVLFGEWLYAKHSIHYTQLPGYFMAFDIFDKQEGRFYSRRMRNEKLDCTGIPVVREIAETTLLGRQEVWGYYKYVSPPSPSPPSLSSLSPFPPPRMQCGTGTTSQHAVRYWDPLPSPPPPPPACSMVPPSPPPPPPPPACSMAPLPSPA